MRKLRETYSFPASVLLGRSIIVIISYDTCLSHYNYGCIIYIYINVLQIMYMDTRNNIIYIYLLNIWIQGIVIYMDTRKMYYTLYIIYIWINVLYIIYGCWNIINRSSFIIRVSRILHDASFIVFPDSQLSATIPNICFITSSLYVNIRYGSCILSHYSYI